MERGGGAGPSAGLRHQIEPAGNAVRLAIWEIHDTPIEEKYLEGGRQGWPMILSGLKTLVETGHALGIAVPSTPYSFPCSAELKRGSDRVNSLGLCLSRLGEGDPRQPRFLGRNKRPTPRKPR